ncbi:MAG: dTDP-4-dehydrorhamnose reductase [Treponema sp.]|jgi:dTDP-4-dehydrorhamnose reductase|nr:dTDP-4-dehydrorhamnose reductase [Treponema sp.]
MIWLIGCKGMLGTELSMLLEKQGVPFTGTDREIDITDPAALEAYTERPEFRGRIGWIVNCAAYTAVDKAEGDVEACRGLNTTGPANIARTARKIGARLIHISTDYVFDGRGIPAGFSGGDPNFPALRPYREDDPTDPIGVYGLTKRDGEAAVLEHNGDSYIVRTAWLYGRHGNNFVHTMLRLMNEQGSVKVVDDQRGSPTWAADLSQALVSLIAASGGAGAEVPGSPAPGVYHYTGEGAVTWFGFAREIYAQGRRLGLITKDCEVRPCTSAEYPARVTRPAYSVLDKGKIKTALGLSIPPWEESLARYLRARGEV